VINIQDFTSALSADIVFLCLLLESTI